MRAAKPVKVVTIPTPYRCGDCITGAFMIAGGLLNS